MEISSKRTELGIRVTIGWLNLKECYSNGNRGKEWFPIQVQKMRDERRGGETRNKVRG
jgi:hypothetical protein